MSLVIIDGIRTPFAKMGTTLASADAVELGRIAVTALLARTGFDPEQVDETIFGCVSQPFDAANIARVIALRAGIPKSKPAMTVHRNCASSLESLTTAAERAAAGHGEVFIVGGTESMSRVPLLFSAAAVAKFAALARAKTWGGKAAAALRFRPGDFAPIAGLRQGLHDPVANLNMGETAEVLAREFGISRSEQDAFALASHQRAAAARDLLREEMCPAYLSGVKGGFVMDDNGVRANQTMEALAKLPAVFERNTGTVTAGNSSQITDGAVAMLVMAEAKAESLGLTPLGRLVDHAYAGCDPARMGLGPAYAIRKLAVRCGLKPSDADVIEINEAFAVQVLAVGQLSRTPDFAAAGLEIPMEKVNPNGGAIALGHPVGSSGGRIVLTALKHLQRTGGKRALCTLCIGGGQGGAVWVERP
ncbi:MAG: thiolase family protein [Verrucomicrobiae bacterium]|nr:thiolase family protein [Verrucomicrobiae bacterium]